MKKKIHSLYEGWKDKGHKDIKSNAEIRKESLAFVEKHDHHEIKKATDNKKEKPTKEDLALGLEIKYLDWLRGVW